MESQQIITPVLWAEATEELIKGIGEKALSMSWLHNRSEKHYKYLNNYLAIPSIILSSITGAGSIGFGEDRNISLIMGGISLLVSILSTLNSYFVFAQRSTEHRIASVQYSKLYLTISIELALPRFKRMNVKDFLKVISQEIQRLNEIQPQVPDIIIKAYNDKFEGKYPNVSKPHITNGLEEIKCYIEEPTGVQVDMGVAIVEPIVEPVIEIKEKKKQPFR